MGAQKDHMNIRVLIWCVYVYVERERESILYMWYMEYEHKDLTSWLQGPT